MKIMKFSTGMRRHMRTEKARIRREVFDPEEVLKQVRALYVDLLRTPLASVAKPASPKKSSSPKSSKLPPMSLRDISRRETTSNLQPVAPPIVIDKKTNRGIKEHSGSQNVG